MHTVSGEGDWAHYAGDPDGGIELLHAHLDRHVYERHSHPTYALGITEQGVQTFSYRGGRHASTVGGLMTFNPDEAHDGEAGVPEGVTYRMVYLEPEVVRGVLEDAAERPVALPWFAAPVVRDTLLVPAVGRLARMLADGAPALEREALFAGVVLGATRRHGDARPIQPGRLCGPRRLRHVRDRLEEDLAEDLGTQDLAVLAGMSRFQMSRAFQRVYGLPPHAYRTQRRLAAAKRLLAAGVPPAEVAAAVGFADQSHLNRRFKGAFGVTPGRYARERGG